MKIESIYISNFKSYSTSGETIPFSTITGFIGANSAGKSNVLEALQLFFFPEKLTEASFHNGDTSRPITIKVAFSDFKGQESFEEKILVRNSRIILARIFSWDILKQQAESKELIPGEMWDYCGRSNCLNPIAIKKISAADMRQFLAAEDGTRFATQANLGASPTVAAFLDTLEAYWNTVALTDEQWTSSFKWSEIDSADRVNKAIKEYVSLIKLPEYIYLPVEHSIDDELSLKKGSRLDYIFSTLLKLNEKQELKKNKDLQKIQDQIDRYYSKYYDHRLSQINDSLNSNPTKWNFSNSVLSLVRTNQSIVSSLQPSWHLSVDDGFSSEVKTKGNGMQRLSVFQLLQVYVDQQKKTNSQSDLILAIEEPELYLHPPYKRALYSLFRKLGNSFQILYTTHDPIFVQLEYFDELRIIRKNHQNESHVKSVDWSIFDQNPLWDKVFRRKKTASARRNELHNKCHGEQNEGFFADKIILVEGNTEKYALPFYFQKLGFSLDRSNISLIEANSVDAIQAIYAIYTAFDIPVYVIFDGDKPKDSAYTIYKCIPPTKSKLYGEFASILERYINEQSDQLLCLLRFKHKSLSNCLPPDLVAELANASPRIDYLKKTYENSMLSREKLEELRNKENRNRKLQSMLGLQDAPGFSSTIISRFFSMWESNFEANISGGLTNYNTLYREACRSCEGKPLTAKYIAQKASIDDFSTELKEHLEAIINAVQLLDSSPHIEVPQLIERPENDHRIISLYSDYQDGSYKVFLCAGGPLNPEADEPVNYASGVFPEGTTYIVRITGQSMEPKIPDGSYLAINGNNHEPTKNDYGIFCLNGNSICKQYRVGTDNKPRLISLNPQVQPIEIQSGDQLDYYGTVIVDRRKKPIILDLSTNE